MANAATLRRLSCMKSPLSARDRKQIAHATGTQPTRGARGCASGRRRCCVPTLRREALPSFTLPYTTRTALYAPFGEPALPAKESQMVKKALAALSFALSTGVAQANGPDATAGESTGLDLRRAAERAIDGSVAEQPAIELTAVFFKSRHGYVGFVEELPGVNSHGRTLNEAREMLREVAAAVFDAERQRAQEMLGGKECLREPLTMAAQMRGGE